MSETTPAVSGWAGRIRPHLLAAAESIIAAGRELLAAKEALPHGQFGPLLDELGLTPRTAQRFMAIARHPVLSDPTHVSHLPGAWGTLYELSRLPGDVVQAALDRGQVSSSTLREDVRGLAEAQSLAAVFEALRQALGISDDEWHERVGKARAEPVDWDACQEMASVGMDQFEAAIERCRAAGDLSFEAVLREIRTPLVTNP